MAPKTLLLQALALSASASILPIPWPAAQNNVCSQLQKIAPLFPIGNAQASAYCTSVFSITTNTLSATSVLTIPITSTLNVLATVTPSPIKPTITNIQTCFQNTATANPALKKRAENIIPRHPAPTPAPAIPDADPKKKSTLNRKWFLPIGNIGGLSSPQLSSACNCFGIDFNPKTTTTITSTTSTIAATLTATTGTTTLPAESAAPTTVLQTNYYTPTGTYSSNSTTYTTYTGYDFKGYDLIGGNCLTGGKGKIVTKFGTYSCAGFNGCLDVCTMYNEALAASRGSGVECRGVTWQRVTGYCYLKNAVPGKGAANCGAYTNVNTLSGIRGLVGTS